MTDSALVRRDLRSYTEALASADPAPGGGSAAAYAGALAAALVEMVGRIASKKGPGAHDAFIAEASVIRDECLRLVDDDADAFATVSAAMKLPRGTDEERALRTERLQHALVAASRVPLAIASAARRALHLCERGLETASTGTISDIGVGALLAEAALRGAALNVMINLAWLRDATQVKALSEELDRVVDGSEAQRKLILQTVESRIAR